MPCSKCTKSLNESGTLCSQHTHEMKLRLRDSRVKMREAVKIARETGRRYYANQRKNDRRNYQFDGRDLT